MECNQSTCILLFQRNAAAPVHLSTILVMFTIVELVILFNILVCDKLYTTFCMTISNIMQTCYT